MSPVRVFLPLLLGLVGTLPVALHAADEAERGYQAALEAYRRDEASLPRLIHYQQVTVGAPGESLRREAWVSLDGVLVKTAEEKRGPKGGELIETSLNREFPYFIFRQKTELQPDGGFRVEEERRYRHDAVLVRWTKRSATFGPGADIEWKGVKQEQVALNNLASEDLAGGPPMAAAQAILATLKKAGPPENDPLSKASPEWARVKLVQEMVSPSGRYQLAWAPDKKDFKWEDYGREDDFSADPDAAVKNYIVDLDKLRIAGETLGRHYGTAPRYNHHTVTMTWSPDEGTFVQMNREKWEFSGCCAGRLLDGQVIGCVDLAVKLEAEMKKFLTAKKDRAWKKNGEAMAIDISDATAADDGTISLKVIGQVPKSEAKDATVSVRVRFRVAVGENGVTAVPLGVAYAKP